MTIIITKEHLTKMKQQLNERMYRIQKTFREEEEYNMACWEDNEFIHSISNNDVLCELDRTYRLCDKIDWYIENLKSDTLEVDIAEWFEMWNFKSIIDGYDMDKYFMFPSICNDIYKKQKN